MYDQLNKISVLTDVDVDYEPLVLHVYDDDSFFQMKINLTKRISL
jgi:hypothetical protein